MTVSKSRRSNANIRNAFASEAIEDDPARYTPQEREQLVRFGLKYRDGLMKGREVVHWTEQAEAFRRRFEIVQIFRGLPQHLRNQPSGQTTKNKVLSSLKNIGIVASQRTLMRDYKCLGGANFLRGVKPFGEGEDRSSPLEEFRRKKFSRSRN
jgi:hypothetical protein